MKTFKEFINERKQVGTIYHFTTCRNLLKLIQGNKRLNLDAFEFVSKNGFISFTRNYNATTYHFPDSYLDYTKYTIRISFDGDKISDKFKIEPIVGFIDNDNDIFNLEKNYKRVKREIGDYEEVLHSKASKGNEFKSAKLLPYIKDIQIYSHDYDTSLECKNEVDKLLKKKRIDRVNVEVVRKFIPLKESSIDTQWFSLCC